jgi:hypothetical protein
MSSLETAYNLWRKTHIPRGATRADFVEIFGDIAGIDTWIADEALPAARDGRPGLIAVDVEDEIGQTRKRIAGILANEQLSDPDRTMAHAYLRYLDVLSRLHAELERLRLRD